MLQTPLQGCNAVTGALLPKFYTTDHGPGKDRADEDMDGPVEAVARRVVLEGQSARLVDGMEQRVPDHLIEERGGQDVTEEHRARCQYADPQPADGCEGGKGGSAHAQSQQPEAQTEAKGCRGASRAASIGSTSAWWARIRTVAETLCR